eukprot:scaffold614142_cov15-Prasinocladus_malaysianus.AAC.1
MLKAAAASSVPSSEGDSPAGASRSQGTPDAKRSKYEAGRVMRMFGVFRFDFVKFWAIGVLSVPIKST